MQTPTRQTDVPLISDRDLLRRFLQDSDESAFAEIVNRHQGLVMGVCRRVLAHDADVDDAFQATFITLARTPRSIRHTASLSSWLYTVAWRTSWRLVKQRRKNAVEPLTRHPLDEPEDPLDRIASAQDCVVLDEELNGLPSKYREVLVMTYFADRSSQQIADELSVSKGTVDGRIRQARNLLRVRLARRGVAIGALAAAAAMSTGAASAATPSILASTIQLGAQTLSSSVPGTTDLSHLEPLIRPETAMLSSKALVSGLLCASALIGAAGLASFSDAPGDGNQAGTNINTLSTDLPAMPVSVTSNLMAATTTRPGAGGAFGGASADGMGGYEGEEMMSGGYGGGMMSGMGMGEDPFNPSRSQLEQWLYQMMDKPVTKLDFPGDTPLPEILNTISTGMSEAFGAAANGRPAKRLTFAMDQNLRSHGLSDVGNVNIQDISFEGMTLRNALKLIFQQTHDFRNSAIPLTFSIDAESILISAVEDNSTYKFYPDDAAPVEKWMHHMLDLPVRNLDFPGDCPLSEILETIETYFTHSFGDEHNGPLRMKFFPDQGELGLEQINSLEDVIISDIAFDGMTLRTALKHIFDQTADDTKAPIPLTYVIQDEVMLVTTLDKAQSADMMSTRVYPVGHLLSIPTGLADVFTRGPGRNAGFTQPKEGHGTQSGGSQKGRGAGFFSVPTDEVAEKKTEDVKAAATDRSPEIIDSRPGLVRLVVDMTINADGDNWNVQSGGNGTLGSIDLFGGNLVVRQTPEVHQQIVHLLNLLSKAVENGNALPR